MRLGIRVDINTPIYQQVVDQVKAQVADGALAKGDGLPSVRTLASDLNINVNTIYKAYKELENQGIVRMRVGFGVTVISERQERLRDSHREKIIRDLVEHLRVEAYHLGFSDDYLVELIRQNPKESTE